MWVWGVGRANHIAGNFPSFAILLLNKKYPSTPPLLSQTHHTDSGFAPFPRHQRGQMQTRGCCQALGFSVFFFNCFSLKTAMNIKCPPLQQTNPVTVVTQTKTKHTPDSHYFSVWDNFKVFVLSQEQECTYAKSQNRPSLKTKSHDSQKTMKKTCN